MLFENQVCSDKIGKELNKKIKEKYGSVKEYADYTQQSQQTIYNWAIEQERLPYLTDFVVNCRLLDVSVDYLCSIAPLQNIEDVELEQNENGKCNSKELPQTVGYIPPIHFEDIILLLPFLGIYDVELLCRFMDNSQSDYMLINIHKRLEKIQTTNAGKYAIYLLEKKYSPLTRYLKGIILNKDDADFGLCEKEYYILKRKKQKWLREYLDNLSHLGGLLKEVN